MKNFKRFIVILLLITFVFNTSFVFADKDKPNAFDKTVGGMFRKLGDAGHAIINKFGFSIDSLIYNQEITVDEDAEVIFKKSIFLVDFSDDTESPFGKLGLVLYSIFVGFALVLMLSILIALGTRLQMNTITRNKVTFSETLSNYVIGFALIYWLPEIMTLFMYLSNFFVSAFNPSNVFGTGYIDTLKAAASDPNNPYLIWDSMVYLGSVAINLYFAFVYGFRAFHIAAFFGFFPLMVLYMNNSRLRQNFDNYLSTLFSTISIQWYDAAIFFGLSYMFNAFGSDPNMAFIKFIMSCAIIPLRAIFQSFFSLNGRPSMANMLGFAGLMGTIGLVRGIVGGTRGVATGVYSGINDMRQARKLKSDYGKWENTATYAERNDGTNQTPYVNVSPSGFSSYAFEKNYSSDDGISFKQKLTPDDVYKHMMRKGAIGIGKSLGKGVGGLAGGLAGAAAGSGFGATGIVYGSHIGGIVGAGAGEGLGAFGGLAGLYGIGGVESFAKLMRKSTKEQAEEDTAHNTSIDIYKGAGNLNAVNNMNYTDGTNINYQYESTAALGEGNVSAGDRPALGPGVSEDIDWDAEHGKHINNMPDEVREAYMREAEEYADRMMSYVDTSGMSESAIRTYWDNFYRLSTVFSGYHYALNKMQEEGIQLDYTKLHSVVDAQKKHYESLTYMHMRYNATGDGLDINEL